MLLRSLIWLSAMRTPWLPLGPATKLSECGAYRPAPHWLCWRGMQLLSPHCRWEDGQVVEFARMIIYFCVLLAFQSQDPNLIPKRCYLHCYTTWSLWFRVRKASHYLVNVAFFNLLWSEYVSISDHCYQQRFLPGTILRYFIFPSLGIPSHLCKMQDH